MVKSFEANMPLDLDVLDISTQKELLEKIKPIVKVITSIARSHKSNLMQNEVRLIPETEETGKKEFSLRLNQNGISAKEYDYSITLNTTKDSTPIYAYIGGKIPVEEGPGEITEAGVVTDRGMTKAKGLTINMISEKNIPLVKDTLEEDRQDILDIVYESLEKVTESLSTGKYKTTLDPKEDGMDQIVGGLSEIPNNLN